MHRLSRHSDYYPTPLKYQYRYFNPTPVVPTIKGATEGRTHTCGVTAHDHGCHIWNEIGATGRSLESQITAVRDHSLKKVLPWRAHPSEDVMNDTSFYTGRGLTYNGAADIFGTPQIHKFPDLVTASNVCAAHATKTHLGEKFSPHEWSYNNRQLYTAAECVHNTTMMTGADAENCIQETLKEQVRCNADTSKDINSRINEVRRWTEREKKELSYNISVTHEMLELKERVETMIKNLEQPLNITQDNIYARESRPGVELVRDAVEESLQNEVETLRKCEARLFEQIEKICDQLSRLRAARHELEVDIRNKEEAKQTDECVRLLCALSKDIGPLNIPDNPIAKSSPISWAHNSQAIVQRSQEERQSAQVLHGEVNRVMMSCSDQCFSMWYETNSNFSSRIKEMCQARDHLQHQFNKINVDIEHLNRRMDEVKKALEEKKPSLKLAQARVEKRMQRPGIELCHDQVTISLMKEIHALQIAINKLASQLNDMETNMQQLMKTRSTLEKDLRLKNVAIFIDKEKCLHLRQNFPISTFKDAAKRAATCTRGKGSDC